MNLVESIKTIQRHYGEEPDGKFGPRTAAAILRGMARTADGMEMETPEILDTRSAATITTLDERARHKFVQFTLLAKATAATFGCDYVAISGHRTWEEQDALYAKRPKVTNARGGYSNHNFGIAADYGVFRGKVYLDDSNPKLADEVHQACAVHAEELGLAWGGAWDSFRDFPHYEVITGLTLAQKRNVYKKRGSVL